MPVPAAQFDIVFSHGVLHHIPDIQAAQREIARVLKPGGKLIAMVYAKNSLNYRLSIAVIRRLARRGLYPFGEARAVDARAAHCARQEVRALRDPQLKNFIHFSTDGPREKSSGRSYGLEAAYVATSPTSRSASTTAALLGLRLCRGFQPQGHWLGGRLLA